MHLCFLVVTGYICCNYAENTQKQYDDTLRMQQIHAHCAYKLYCIMQFA